MLFLDKFKKKGEKMNNIWFANFLFAVGIITLNPTPIGVSIGAGVLVLSCNILYVGTKIEKEIEKATKEKTAER